MRATISSIVPGSIAEELGLRPGDELLSVNGEPVRDLIDYRFLTAEEHVKLRLQTPRGERIVEVDKHPDEDLGLVFDDPTFGTLRRCTQRCIFCFVDQLPPGMRRTMRIKDDDYRLSFLLGNFVTLTNLSADDVERIVRLRLSPLYVSVHATDEATRARLFRTRTHMRGLENLRYLAQRGIEFHAQIVLCPTINDGPQLERTVFDLAALFPGVRSVAVVPVGLTKHRRGLYPLTPVGPELAGQVIAQVRRWQEGFLARLGTRFVFAADELYLCAGAELPAIEEYEDFPQVENGVGLCVPFFRELKQELEARRPLSDASHVAIVTGRAAKPLFDTVLGAAYDGRPAPRVIAAKNELFGEQVTVAPLLGGRDVAREVRALGQHCDLALVPSAALNEDGLFLDDLSLDDVRAQCGVALRAVAGARELVEILAGNERQRV